MSKKQKLMIAITLMNIAIFVGFGISEIGKRVVQWQVTPIAIHSVTEEERSALIAGMVLGLDMALASRGAPPMDRERWRALVNGFDQLTKDCKDMNCLMGTIMALRETVRQQKQLGPEVFH